MKCLSCVSDDGIVVRIITEPSNGSHQITISFIHCQDNYIINKEIAFPPTHFFIKTNDALSHCSTSENSSFSASLPAILTQQSALHKKRHGFSSPCLFSVFNIISIYERSNLSFRYIPVSSSCSTHAIPFSSSAAAAF